MVDVPPDREAEIRLRVEKAAMPADCRASPCEEVRQVCEVIGDCRVVARAYAWHGTDSQRYALSTERAELIAHAPGDLSYLLGEVASLRQQNAEIAESLRGVTLDRSLLRVDAWVLLTKLEDEVNPETLERFGPEIQQLRASLVPGEKEVPR